MVIHQLFFYSPPPGLYTFTSFTFTNGTQTGDTGPSTANLLASYNTTANPWLNNASYFTTSSGIQLWTVPRTASYIIEAAGARGAGTSSTPGYGAKMIGTFSLTAGDILKILVGQMGSLNTVSSPCGYFQGGGGGGSFVATNSNTPLIVAGGGGGAAAFVVNAALRDGNTSTSGNTADGSTTANGGTSGNGGNNFAGGCVAGAGPGGGFTGNGATPAAGYGNPGLSFVNGGAGGAAVGLGNSSGQPAGGFGGGGGGSLYSGGGGGGYSGGGGGGLTACACANLAAGGGGGSYNNGTNQTNTGGVNTGHGYVTITAL